MTPRILIPLAPFNSHLREHGKVAVLAQTSPVLWGAPAGVNLWALYTDWGIDHKIHTCSPLVDNANSVPRWLDQYVFPSTSSVCSTCSPMTGLAIFSLNYSGGCVKVSHFGYNLYFLDDLWGSTPFHVTGHVDILISEVSVQVSSIFLDWVRYTTKDVRGVCVRAHVHVYYKHILCSFTQWCLLMNTVLNFNIEQLLTF